jgi:hypothetical protein
MNAPSLQTLHVPPCLHWIDPVSREEELARREKFQKVGWRPPNHKPKTKGPSRMRRECGIGRNLLQVTFTYVLSRYERLTACSQILHIGVNADQHLQESGPSDFEDRIDWTHRVSKKRSHETVDNLWRWLCQAYTILARQPTDRFTKTSVTGTGRLSAGEKDRIQREPSRNYA